MNKPTVLRNSAEPEIVLGIALKIYYNANDWVSNATFLDKLDIEYDAIGKERESRTGGQAVAKYKPSLYYGLLDCRPEDDCKRINEYGIRYYEAYTNNNQDVMVDCLIASIIAHTFGRNNAAVPNSDSKIEPPKVFLLCSVLLGGINKTEYAYAIEQLAKDEKFQSVLMSIMLSRQLEKELQISDYAKNNYKDDKGLKFLADAGLFEEIDGKRVIKEKYKIKYFEQLSNLSIFNDEESNKIKFNEPNDKSMIENQPLQQIFYGAPGTGKSHAVKKLTGELDDAGNEHEMKNVFRTTFHPDTDYATFVGCYKPTMQPTSKEEKTLTGKDEEITYEFVPQAFTDAYVYAYNHQEEATYLVIEEINRGNCAQIFGDLFQLLDRKADGTSEYTIKADKDLAKYLTKELESDSEGIKDGKLRLPANLNILATMNTSDQSLFPMDSAFKRRWEWEYIAISYTEPKSSAFMINVGDGYSWVEFIKQVNKRIFALTQSEDKELGNFFIKDSIEAEQFTSKVMFYLWYEVLRDEVENSKYFFHYTTQDETGKETNHKFTFTDLYGDNAEMILEGFLKYIAKGAE